MARKFILFFILISVQIFPQNDLKVISSNRNFILIEYTPGYLDTAIIEIDNRKFIKVGLKDGFIPQPENWGMPSVPEKDINIGVPSQNGNTLQIVSSDYKIIEGNLVPKPRMIRNDGMGNFVYEVGKDYKNYKPEKEPVSFGAYGLMRDIPVQVVRIMPVEYNPVQGKIKIYSKIIFRVNFSPHQVYSSNPAGNFVSGAIINFDVSKYWTQIDNAVKLKKSGSNSVLVTGKWVRFEAPAEGIYKITRSMLPSFGIDPGSVDPRTIKIYNNGGKALPEDLAAPRPDDLVENAILIVGQDDGKFDDGDYILFYGRGTNFWEYDTAGKAMARFNDPYSNQNYYWITSGGNSGKRIGQQKSLNVQAPFRQNLTQAFVQWDKDKINIGQSGREYYGDNFKTEAPVQTYLNKLNGRLDNYPVNYKVRFINASPDNNRLEVDENNFPIINNTLYGYGFGNDVDSNGISAIFTASYEKPLPGDNSLLKFNFISSSASAQGYLDYFEISYIQQLEAVNNSIMFFSKDTSAVIQFDLSGFSSSNIKVFNVTDYSNVKLITDYVLQSGGNCSFQAQESGGSVSKYIAVGNDNFLSPVNPVEMQNSNLRGIQQGARLIIITNKLFEDAAQRLKTYKESQTPVKISSIVVDIDKIYNEFSCGMMDPTAMRDFIKYAFDNWQIKPEYVLFFGKGTCDPKDVGGYNQDFVPAYETQQSLNQVTSYTTDDFFVKVNGNDQMIDLAYGRIPCTNINNAGDAVDKIIKYETATDIGTWRNLFTLVADDDYTSKGYEGYYHSTYSEYLSNHIIPGSFDQNKIYLGMYPVVLTSDGRRYPQVNKDIINSMNNGTLIINYFGHGDPHEWAHEQVFEKATSIPQLNNEKYFFLVAATCDFGYWDIPNYQSAAEELVLLKNAGAIATLTSARLAYAEDNQAMADQFFGYLLNSPRDQAGLPITIGQALFLTKQSLFDINSQKYQILGDPTIRLAFPRYTGALDSINGESLSNPVQIKALSKVHITGEIMNSDNSLWKDFNGTGVLTVYDSKREIIVPAISSSLQISQQGGVIFRGNISVANGKFASDFAVPKDISYEDKNGKAVIYFYNGNTDGLGYSTNIIVGGTDSSQVNNKIGPEISIFFDDTTSQVISLVNPNSTLIVKLFDENGLNTTGTGIGHKMEGIFNGDINNPVDFTNYFTGDLNSGGKSGKIIYKLNGFSEGNYFLKVTAWDVFNNFSSKAVSFSVISSDDLVIKNVYNYPDPFAGNTTFTFQQNINAPLNVKIKIYTVAGRMIREIERSGVTGRFVKIAWDGRDQDGDLPANGTYLYKVIINSTDGRFSKSALGKLAIIR